MVLLSIIIAVLNFGLQSSPVKQFLGLKPAPTANFRRGKIVFYLLLFMILHTTKLPFQISNRINSKMGQYYKVIILGEKPAPATSGDCPSEQQEEIIRVALRPYNYSQGAKIMEHSYIGNELVSLAEYLLSPIGMFYKSRLVWAGDYADGEPSTGQNLYHAAHEPQLLFSVSKDFDASEYRYIVNHTKREFVDKQVCLEHQLARDLDDNKPRLIVHPLPLLVSEGNGCGGGDYWGPGEDDCGRWARDIISMERTPPHPEKGYVEFVPKFESN